MAKHTEEDEGAVLWRIEPIHSGKEEIEKKKQDNGIKMYTFVAVDIPSYTNSDALLCVQMTTIDTHTQSIWNRHSDEASEFGLTF